METIIKPLLTLNDYQILKNIVQQWEDKKKSNEILLLEKELSKAKVLKQDELPEDIIRIGSYFEVKEENSDKTLKFWLELPEKANFQEKKISVLSAIGVALIGYQQGMTVECVLPVGTKKLTIMKVKNPES